MKTLWPEGTETGFEDVFADRERQQALTGEQRMEHLRRVLAGPNRERFLERLSDQERARIERVEEMLRRWEELRGAGHDGGPGEP